jgi:hypothetical protein
LKKQLQMLQDKVDKDKAGKEDKKKQELDKLYKELKAVNEKFSAEQKDHAKRVQDLYAQIQKLGGKTPQWGYGPAQALPPGAGIIAKPPTTGGIPVYPQPGHGVVEKPVPPGFVVPQSHADLEKRVKELEKKVDMLMKEQQKKQAGVGGMPGGFGQPGLKPGANPQPPGGFPGTPFKPGTPGFGQPGGPGTGPMFPPGAAPPGGQPGAGPPGGFPGGPPGMGPAGGFPSGGAPPQAAPAGQAERAPGH